MTDTLFFTALFLVGLAWTRVARQPLGAAFCYLAAYPLGLLVWVLVSLLLVLGPTAYAAGLVAGALAVVCAAGLALSLRAVQIL